jgi:hypothetical protein
VIIFITEQKLWVIIACTFRLSTTFFHLLHFRIVSCLLISVKQWNYKRNSTGCVCLNYFSRNLVVALKELSIRGDFRTTVEYLTKLIETESFQNNSCDTGWLDKLISEKVQVNWHRLWGFCLRRLWTLKIYACEKPLSLVSSQPQITIMWLCDLQIYVELIMYFFCISGY